MHRLLRMQLRPDADLARCSDAAQSSRAAALSQPEPEPETELATKMETETEAVDPDPVSAAEQQKWAKRLKCDTL
jgi:hypothetical protein